jgi:Gluconate 2-dehydrogenase subunit 3
MADDTSSGGPIEGGPGDGPDATLTRRDAIKLGAAATFTASLALGETLSAQVQVPGAPRPRVFFTSEELALVDELSELIIPTDQHSPGARAARVAGYIDARLAEAWDEQDRTMWRQGLAGIERLSREERGRAFLQSSPDQRVALLTRIAANERQPKTPEERFFVELKTRVVRAYYTSEIGIRQELEYKGNSYLAEFVGTDVSQP